MFSDAPSKAVIKVEHMVKLNLAIDRGNGSVKYLAHLEDDRNYRNKFASLLLPNPDQKIKPVYVDEKEWLYGANAGKGGLSIAISPSQEGTQGKINHFAVVLAAVLQELSFQVDIGTDITIETLSVVNPIVTPGLVEMYKAEVKNKAIKINGEKVKVTVKRWDVRPESAVILEKTNMDMILDVGFGTCLGTVRGWDEVISFPLEYGSEQIIREIVNHPDFSANIELSKGKALPSMELVALFLAKGNTEIRGVDLVPLLKEIVPAWFDEKPLAMLPKMRRFASENDRKEAALLTGGGAQLLKLALGYNVKPWCADRNCVLAEDADYMTVQTLGELWENQAVKKQAV